MLMGIEHESDSALARAVRAAGSQSAFGRWVGKRQSSVREWLIADRLPDVHVLTVEEKTGISRHELRPDIFGPAPANTTAAPPAHSDLEPNR